MSAIDEELDLFEYELDDRGYAKEEPDCGGCNDSRWYTPRDWRRVLAQLAPILWGWRVPRSWRPPRGTWPCSSCNACWLDWTLWRIGCWRYRRGRRRTEAGAFDDEPPF